jgi:hypothetical protein
MGSARVISEQNQVISCQEQALKFEEERKALLF